jgi:phosphoglycerate kinase
MQLKTLEDIPIKENRVIVRVDWDVPIKMTPGASAPYQILDDSRIRAAFSTFDELLRRKVRRIFVMFHLGRPGGRRVEELRTTPIKSHFVKIYPRYSKEKFHVLDNIRFDPREEKNSYQLAKRYAGFSKAYVNDAFPNSHRKHMSMVALAKLLPSAAGLNLLKEVENLSGLKDNPEHPFVVIIGGAKIEDKKSAILNLVKISDKVLIGGKTALEVVKDKEITANKKVVIAQGGKKNQRGDIWDIDDETIAKFKQELQRAKTVFWNGNLGKSEEKGFEKGSVAIARCIAGLKAKKVAAGGDTVALINRLKLKDEYSFVSLGGGASLAFLAGEKLPGLEVLKR